MNWDFFSDWWITKNMKIQPPKRSQSAGLLGMPDRGTAGLQILYCIQNCKSIILYYNYCSYYALHQFSRILKLVVWTLPLGSSAEESLQPLDVRGHIDNSDLIWLHVNRLGQDGGEVLVPGDRRELLLQFGNSHWVVQLSGITPLLRGQGNLKKNKYLRQFLD